MNIEEGSCVDIALVAASRLFEHRQVVRKANISAEVGGSELLQLQIKISERSGRIVRVRNNLDVALVIGFQLIVSLDLRRELHAISDITKLLHCKFRHWVALSDVEVLNAIIDGSHLVGVCLVVDDPKETDLVITVGTSVQTEVDIFTDTKLVVDDRGRLFR